MTPTWLLLTLLIPLSSTLAFLHFWRSDLQTWPHTGFHGCHATPCWVGSIFEFRICSKLLHLHHSQQQQQQQQQQEEEEDKDTQLHQFLTTLVAVASTCSKSQRQAIDHPERLQLHGLPEVWPIEWATTSEVKLNRFPSGSIWKAFVKLDHFRNFRGENRKMLESTSWKR